MFQVVESGSGTSTPAPGDLERAHSEGDLLQLNKRVQDTRRDSK